LALPDFLRVESAPDQPKRALGLHETEHFLLLATYHLWREDAVPIDGEALDMLRGRLSPHPQRDLNRQFSENVLELALHRLETAGLLERRAHSLWPTARAVDELERAMRGTGKTVEGLMRRILGG
jgi:hypothetical protein